MDNLRIINISFKCRFCRFRFVSGEIPNVIRQHNPCWVPPGALARIFPQVISNDFYPCVAWDFNTVHGQHEVALHGRRTEAEAHHVEGQGRGAAGGVSDAHGGGDGNGQVLTYRWK